MERDGPRARPDADGCRAWGISLGLWFTAWRSATWTVLSNFAADHFAAIPAAMCVGVIVAGRLVGRRRYSMGGYGVTLWLAGLSICWPWRRHR